jgi:hypothetical protein
VPIPVVWPGGAQGAPPPASCGKATVPMILQMAASEPVWLRTAKRSPAASRGSPVFFTNPRARIFGGGGLIAMSVVLVSSATAVPRHRAGGVVAFVVLAVVTLLLGLRAARGFVIRLIPPELELRSSFRNRRLPLAGIDRFEPHVGSEGLIYRKTYIHIVMKDGTSVPCKRRPVGGERRPRLPSRLRGAGRGSRQPGRPLTRTPRASDPERATVASRRTGGSRRNRSGSPSTVRHTVPECAATLRKATAPDRRLRTPMAVAKRCQ